MTHRLNYHGHWKSECLYLLNYHLNAYTRYRRLFGRRASASACERYHVVTAAATIIVR
jgi:hypothetical protein